MGGFELLTALVALLAGAVASVAGFGIGSLLTPVLALAVGTKVAVAAVSIPHLLGTALRFWRLRMHVDRHVLLGFGLTSAAGGLAGALLHAYAGSAALGIVFGCLLILAGASELSGLMRRLDLERRAAWVAGATSGFFGGLVGNQGGIRSAALLGFDVRKEAFVATATAIALIVDLARMPVYLAVEREAIAAIWMLVAIASVGVIVGTLLGERVLRRVPERAFRAGVAALLLALGVYMIAGSV